MKALLLAVCLALLAPHIAFASTVGNPDERPSLLLGAGYGWGETKLYRTVFNEDNEVEASADRDLQRIYGIVTLPTSRSLSLVLSLVYTQEPEPRNFGSYYTRTFVSTADIGFRIFFR